jgi:MFS family permease
MYIGEIAPAAIRGRLVSMNQIAIVVGLSAAYFSNYLLLQIMQAPPQWMATLGFSENVWRWMLGVEIIPALLWLLMLFVVPESPRWLVFNGQEGRARTVLSKLIPENEIDAQIEEIKSSALEGQNEQSVVDQLKDMISNKYRMAMLIGITVAVVQPITGINAIMFYAPTVFEQVGVGTDAAFFQSVVIGLVSIVFTVLALLTIDKFGRRPIVILGLSSAALSLMVCSWGFSHAKYELDQVAVNEIQLIADDVEIAKLSSIVGIKYDNDVSFKQAVRDVVGRQKAKTIEADLIQKSISINVTLVLIGLIAFIASFQFSIGPIMWVVFSEIVPTHLRGVAIPFFALWTSVISYFVQQFFPWQLTVMGVGQIFLFYAVLVILGLLALVKLLPETKNRTIEEIELELLARRSA